MELFDSVAYQCSETVTRAYSTSFTLGIRALAPRFRPHVYAVYGFVRYADEIVDTFHDRDKAALLAEFRADTYRAIESRLSMNPILHAFQATVNKYGIERALIDAFLHSMEMDLTLQSCDQGLYDEYIYGSAQVVGLMCLRIFVEGDDAQYERLKPPAMRLGAAFQKVNFLRDMRADYAERGRTYFPDVDFSRFDGAAKAAVERDIEADFAAAREGIHNLPAGARMGVYLAYTYYLKLFAKIRKAQASAVLQARIRISNRRKLGLLARSWVEYKTGLV